MKETVKIDKRKLRGKYDTHVEPRLEEIKAWARDGMTEEEIAKNLGVSYSTFKDYKHKYPALVDSLKHARAYDNEVVYALHRNTLGGIVKLKKPIKLRKSFFADGKKIREEEYVEYVEEETYIKPDTLAQIYWLNNRMPDKWRDKPQGGQNNGNGADEENVNPNELKIVVEKKVVDLTEGIADADNQL